MSAGPLVSVIIPAYNYGRFIEDALESVLAQTYRRFELIVVDDGSTDDTRARVGRFASRVTYIHQPNGGLSAARNTGILAARGSLLAFLDADDVWLPRKLERQVATIDIDPKVGVVYSWWGYMDETRAPLPQTTRPAHRGPVFEELLRGPFAAPSTWLIRRACFERVGLFDPRIKRAEDWDLLLRIAGAGYHFAYAPEILMRNRLHGSHLSGDVVKTSPDRRRALAKTLAQLAPDARRTRLRKTAYRHLYVSDAMLASAQGEQARADAWLAKAVRLDPGASRRPGFYLGMAFGLLPFGRRTRSELSARLAAVAATLTGLTDRLFSRRGLPGATASEKRAAWSALYLALALLHVRCGHWLRAASCAGRSLAADPLTVAATLGRAAKGHWRAVKATLPI